MSYLGVTHTLNDIIRHVKRQFGDEASVQVSDEDIAAWTNQGQAEIFNRVEPIKSSINTDLIAGQAIYEFPADVSRVQAIYVNGLPIEQLSTQEAEEYVLKNDPNSTVTGQPQIWSEWAGSFTFYPIPEVGGTIQLRYIRKPTQVTLDAVALSVPDPFYNRLLEYVLQQAYELDENFTASQLKGDQFANNLVTQPNRESVSSNTYPTITVLDEDL